MALFPAIEDDAIFLSRSDESEVLASYAANSFQLDDFTWPTVEHYFQAMKFDDQHYQRKISLAPSAKKARQLGRTRLKKIRKAWKTTRKIMMTRAVYISARTNQAVYDALMQTADKQIIESSAYDYYWGWGRDRRGENQYGKVLMQVRAKLRQEQQAESSS